MAPDSATSDHNWIRAPANSATRVPTMHAREKSFGNSTPFPAMENPAQRPGASIVARTGPAITCGRSHSRWTSKPIFDVEERPVAKGDVPTEWFPPTQPFPVKPPAITRVSMTAADLVTAADTNEEHARACRELWDKTNFYNTGPYTQWKFKKE